MLYEAARLASFKDVDLSKIVSHRYSLSNIAKINSMMFCFVVVDTIR